MILRILATLVAILCLTLLATPASAASVFNTDASGGVETNPGNYGNTRTYTNAGLSAMFSGWGLTGGASNTTFETAYLGYYGGAGLGVCDREEGCGSPDHQVDNVGRENFVLVTFSSPVTNVSFVIDPYGTYDRDVSYWVGTGATPNLNGATLVSLASLGFGPQVNDNASPSSSARTVNVAGTFSYVLFGAQVGPDTDDFFKIRSVTASAIPEPGSAVLVGAGLLGLSLVARRRRRH